MELIEARMESLGFDEKPEEGATSGGWMSGDDDERKGEFEKAADMMWEAQDMMAEAKEEASMTRHAVEDMQEQMGLTPAAQREEIDDKPRYERTGVSLADAGMSSGPALPSTRMMDLDGDGMVTDEERQRWESMSPAEKAARQAPITDIVSSILNKNIKPKDKCHCGSKKMYKDCHMKRDQRHSGSKKKGKKGKKKW